MASTRRNLKLNKDIEAEIEKIPTLPEQYESITLDDDLFDHFMRTCNEMKLPNQALVDAASFAKGQ